VPFPTDHRPWPLPRTPWLQAQGWRRLLFAHWPIDPAALRALVPPQLALDSYAGQTWIGIVPFYLAGLRGRGLPALPGLSSFPEVNVRTYVTLEDRPGVFFFSLDAGNPAAVAGGRWLHLPYFYAWMDVGGRGDAVDYASRRLAPRPLRVHFRGRYRPVGPVYNPLPGSLDYFLTERYCLYTVDRAGAVARLEVHHPPWPLQPAEAEIEQNSLTAPIGLPLPDVAPLLHYAASQDMVAFWPRAVAAGRR